MGARKYEANGVVPITVSGSAATSSFTLKSGENYVLSSNVDLWFRTDGSDAAVATAGSNLMGRGATDITGLGKTISVIKDAGADDGKASIGLGSL